MNTTEVLRTAMGRRRFLGIAGGVAAAGAVTAACGTAGEYEPIGPTKAPSGNAAQAAASPTAMASSDHGALPPLDPNPNKVIVLEAKDALIEAAAGVKVSAWSFGGTVPGPVVRVRQGDTIDFTLRNRGTMGHSIDFHAAQTPWNINYETILPNEEIHFTWKANYPGAFMYHCGTGPVLQHIANGMYGAIIVDPAEGWRPARE